MAPPKIPISHRIELILLFISTRKESMAASLLFISARKESSMVVTFDPDMVFESSNSSWTWSDFNVFSLTYPVQ